MFIDPFQEKIWRDKYQYGDESFEDFCDRISNNIFKKEKKKREQLKSLLMDFKILFGGRINSNIGISEKGLTLFNCFIEATVKSPDSLEGILDMVTKYAVTLKTEGGVGFCANFLRPAKTLIRKIGVTTPGSIKFLEIFDRTSEVITSGSVAKDESFQGEPSKKSIRKGATMVTMSVTHPDIEDFITAKSVPNRLTKMNMSVLVSDAFMYAVENDMDWDLWFPDINYEKYDTDWDGDFEKWAEKGYPTIIYKTLKARDLWDSLLRNTYNRNEPGILFIDNIRRDDNLHYTEGSITATNPCIVGGTLIAVADGRNAVSIRDLANSKKDVPVYSTNPVSGKVEIKLGRDPRKTGFKKEVWKLNLDDGSYLIATPDHKILTKDLDYVELRNLKKGESIYPFNSFNSNGYRQIANEDLISLGKKVFSKHGKLTKKIWLREAKKNGWQQNVWTKFRFGSFSKFKGLVLENHKVLSVEFYGYEDVYNITVDDNHNYHVITKYEDSNFVDSSGICVKNCGEVPGNTGIIDYEGEELELGDVCNLGSINLARFYDVEADEFDFDGFRESVNIMVEALDNIIEISDYPLPMYENASKLKRKVGLGLAGFGSLMMMMGNRYGGDASVAWAKVLLKDFMNTAYTASAELSKRKGPFPLYKPELLEGGYVKNSGVLEKETIDFIKKHGLRNSAISAIAPNGTLSILAGNVSGGLEPVYACEYTRWNRVEGKKVDFKYPNIHKGEWFETDYFKEQQIADEVILISTDGEYRVDKNNGLCSKIRIRDYGYDVAVNNGSLKSEAKATATELSVEEHLNILRVFSEHIDQSCSKTINLPENITFDEFKTLYGKIHSFGVKGCTTYREGTSVAILEADRKKKEKSIKAQQKEFLSHFKGQENGDIVAEDVKLPEQYPAHGYILRSEGKKWYVHVAFKDKACTRPFAIFVNTNNREDNVVTYNALEKMEEIARSKGLKTEHIEETQRKYAYQKNPVKICRMLGLLLRHNVDVYAIVKGFDELEGATPGTFVFRMKKFLAQFVKNIDEPQVCPDCKEKALVFAEGCFTCTQCGHSKCS